MPSKSPFVAVVLPVFNTARYLPECLDSLLNQTYSHFQIFAVDDGSYDSSGEILDQYAEMDKRLQVIHKANAGVASARNLALDVITASEVFEFVCFVDSDDVVVPEFIETLVQSLDEFDAEYCVCGVERYNQEAITFSGITSYPKIPLNQISALKHYCHIDEWEFFPSNIYMTSRIFAISLLKSVRFNESLKVTEDQDFILRALLGLKKGVWIPNVLYRYRQRASSLSHSQKSTMESSFLLAKLLLENSNKFPQELRHGLEMRVCSSWLALARQGYVRGGNAKRKQLNEFLEFILNNCDINSLPKKYKKRFRIFALGKWATYLYLFLFHSKSKSKTKRLFD